LFRRTPTAEYYWRVSIVPTRSRKGCSTHLKKLCEIGILREKKSGREKLFINPHLLAVLEATPVP